MKSISSYISIAPLILFALTACNTTQNNLYNEWSSNAYSESQGKINRVLTLGIVNDPENRHKLEHTFADELSKINVDAVPSLEVMSADTDINKQTVEEAIEGKSIDAVLVIQLVRLENAEIYKGHDPSKYWSETDFLQGSEYYSADPYSYANDSNSTTTKLVALIKISLYHIETEQYIWSANSQSLDPTSADGVIRELTTLVINRFSSE